ncbi:hypothetical protein BDV93DRAFT_497363 [Ceratobasidium sp. AG-I]|nr:hypothetical protein BDV93DRAFT_497363 [Ceratobasidium sp. AG-I]
MAQRGFDTTVDVDSARAHESAFAVAVEDRVCFELGIDRRSVDEAKRALDLHYEPEQLSVVSVTEDGAANSHCVSRSVITPSSVAGRGTKGYWSLNISTQELCFLKDTWRATRSNSELEGDIVRELCEKGVRNVPALVCHGVVASENKTQRTRTQEFISASWVKRSLSEVKLRQHIVERVHYRMVSSTLGCSLHEHDNLQELLFAAGDMTIAVLDAEEKCQRLHRDISSNNVILVRDRVSQVRKAYVIDWEHSVKTERLKVENHSISGTWQFISHRLLRQNDAAPHHIHDDIESIFWVTCWYLLLYYSTWSTEQPASRRRQMLDGSHHSFDIFADGTEKCLELMERTCLKRGLSNNPTALEWATRYAKYLSRPMLARANGIDKPVQDPKELEGMVFDLAETAPRDILKSTPNWKELKLYHPLGRNGLWPAIPSASVLDNMPASDVEEMSE